MQSLHDFEEFMKVFWWLPNWHGVFDRDHKCLENVFLCLYFRKYFSVRHFTICRSPQLNAYFWQILRDLPRLTEGPALGDIVLTGTAPHAMIYLNDHDGEYWRGKMWPGFYYGEYHRKASLTTTSNKFHKNIFCDLQTNQHVQNLWRFQLCSIFKYVWRSNPRI